MKILYAFFKLILLMIAITLMFACLTLTFIWLYPLAMYDEFKFAWLLTMPIGITLLIFFASVFNWQYLTEFNYNYED